MADNLNVDPQKKALLEAVAQAGNAGRQAYEQAQTELNQTRQAALGRLSQAAAGSGVGFDPSGLEQQQARFQSALDVNRAGFEGSMARMQGANESYLGQVQAALPLSRARIDEETNRARIDLENEVGRRRSDLESSLALAKQRYDAEQRQAAEDRAYEMEKRAFEREKMGFEREKLQAERAGGGLAGLSDSELRNKLIGTGRSMREQDPNVGVPFPDMPSKLQGKPFSDTELATRIGDAAGLDAGRLRGILTPQVQAEIDRANAYLTGGTGQQDDKKLATKAAVNLADIPKIRQDPDYIRLSQQVAQDIQDGFTYEEWEEMLRGELFGGSTGKKNKDRTFRLLTAQYAPLFQSIAEANRLEKFGDGE